jgi:AcrR family transcriptional regulator
MIIILYYDRNATGNIEFINCLVIVRAYMRYEKGHKESTRLLILEVASKQFRKGGIEAVGIAGLMKEAGLTNGAFYSHFKSKKDLVDQTLIYIMEEREELLKNSIKQGFTLKEIIHEYLSAKHRDKCEQGCLFPSLTAEIARLPKSTKNIVTEKIKDMQNFISEQINESNPEVRNQKAIAIVALMIGSLQLARVVTDNKLSDNILKHATENVLIIAGI